MELVVYKSVVRLLLTVVTLSCSAAAVSPVSGCELYNDLYICTGAQYRMHCNTTKHHFYYQRNQNQHQYQCLGNDCVCVGNIDTCVCYNNTSSCFCDTFSSNISVPAADSYILDCMFNNGSYTCIGAQNNMYCNTTLHYFSYYINPFQNQNQYFCWTNNCDCSFNKNSCSCSNPTSSCFCTNYGYSTSLSSGQSSATIPDCVVYNDTYVCTGTLYRMYCNTRIHNFNYWRNQNPYQYQCRNHCDCIINTQGSCSCSFSTPSSCFCETLSNSAPFNTNLPPVSAPDCELYNDNYICTGAQYRMYCNTQVHYFTYQRYQNQHQYQCVSDNCNCVGNKDTCACYTSTWSSCFCEIYGNTTALTTARSPVYECVLYKDTYICTGAQYRMFCNTSLHNFYYNINSHQCTSSICSCTGNKNTCSCSSSAPSSCYCTDYSNNIIPAGVSPVYDCVLYNDTYVCTGAQYRMFCNTSMHNFNYQRYTNQNQYHSQCSSNYCNCYGNKDTCKCYSRALSSCFCESYGKSITLTTAVSPVYECVLYKDTYICTGAQYRMFCNTSLHNFYYNINSHQCTSSNCTCTGNKNTCSCSTSAPSSCYCTDFSNNITIPAGVSPVYDCVLFKDTYVCTGAQYRMFCNISMNSFSYWRNTTQNQYQSQCSSDCYCNGNKDTCTCYSSTWSSCYCESYITTTTTTTPSPTTPALTITLPDQCTSQGGCLQNLLQQLENVTQLPLSVVSTVLDMALNTSAVVLPSTDSKELVANGNRVLQASEKLLSALVKPTETSDNVSFTLDTVEVKVFSIGPKFASEQFPQLDTKTASMDIDLIGIAKSNKEKGSAAVAFMSYTTMENLLKAEFFNTQNNTNKTMMSTVISATLPKTTNTTLTKPVNFTFRHIREFEPSGSLSCVYWNISEWIVDGCSVLNSNSSHTVCSCVHLSTFALIMQTSSSPPPSDLLELLGLVCVIVGLVFFSLALLSFALCQWSPGVNNVARINICISLLSAHLLFLLTQQFLSLIRPQQVLCVVIAGLLHFLFLSAFVWMFIEAVLLFICVKNLSQISSKKKEVLSSGFLCVIGYVLAMVVVCVSVGLVPEGYGSEHCWIKYDKGFIWSFLGPVCVILALNLILFIRIVIYLNSALSKLNAEISQMKQTKVMVFKTLGQFVVLGCPWILGFFTNSSEVLEILFLILNSQQGTFIFLIYCLLNNEIRQQYWKCFTFLCSGHKPSKIN